MSDQPETMEQAFGELRSLLNEPQTDENWRKRLCALLERANQLNEEMYQDQWVGYLAGFPVRWRQPLRTLTSPNDLMLWTTLAPFAWSSTTAASRWKPLKRWWPPPIFNISPR